VSVSTHFFQPQKELDDYVKGFKTQIDNKGSKIYYSDKQGLYFIPTVKGSQTPPGTPPTGTTGEQPRQATKVDPTAGMTPPENKPAGYGNGLPMLLPDQSNLPPNLLQPGLRQMGHVQANAIRISPEETLKELNRQYSTASDSIISSNSIRSNITNMKYSTTGYKDNSPDKNEGSLMIPGNLITMKGVSKQLTLIPIVGGKPQYGRKRIAKPGDSDIQFESDVESVLELPYAQVGTQLQNPYVQNFIDNQNSVPKINTPPPAYFQPPQGNVNMNPAGIFSSNQSLNTSGIDPNLIQQKEAQKTTEKQKDQPFQGAINPYGGKNAFFKSDDVDYLTKVIRKDFERPGEAEANDNARLRNAYSVLGQTYTHSNSDNYSEQYNPQYANPAAPPKAFRVPDNKSLPAEPMVPSKFLSSMNAPNAVALFSIFQPP